MRISRSSKKDVKLWAVGMQLEQPLEDSLRLDRSMGMDQTASESQQETWIIGMGWFDPFEIGQRFRQISVLKLRKA